MDVITYPKRSAWKGLTARPAIDAKTLYESVRPIVDDVRREGDSAVLRYGEVFDHVRPSSLITTPDEITMSASLVAPGLRLAIGKAALNIEAFHSAQRFGGIEVETVRGVVCRQKAVAIEKVGLYVPGGTAPLFSTVLMLGIPARIAGCKDITLCTPPREDGSIHPAILFAASVAGVTRVVKAGGAQAVAAMAFGTASIPGSYKIFGPGNQYVTAAKQIVSLEGVAIDMPAGPSEVEVIADGNANPSFIASDILSQAEHGADSQAILVTASPAIVPKVIAALSKQIAALPRKETALKALANSRIIVLRDSSELIDFTNLYAPEHLIIQTDDYQAVAERVTNAGSVFMGAYTPESAGDYASGTNHTLPTGANARAFSGVNLDSFIRKITYQEITPSGLLALGDTIRSMAGGELLEAHRNAVTIRLNTLKDNQ
ncbi:MAG: histidinol dehydrogenase [Tannerellaceae bacterium]|nr:histidinol dehydrogenase [Tannerellaceae bacterium]